MTEFVSVMADGKTSYNSLEKMLSSDTTPPMVCEPEAWQDQSEEQEQEVRPAKAKKSKRKKKVVYVTDSSESETASDSEEIRYVRRKKSSSNRRGRSPTSRRVETILLSHHNSPCTVRITCASSGRRIRTKCMYC